MINVNAVSGSRLQVAGSIERGEDPKKVADVQRPTAPQAAKAPIPADKMYFPGDMDYYAGEEFEYTDPVSNSKFLLSITEDKGAYFVYLEKKSLGKTWNFNFDLTNGTIMTIEYSSGIGSKVDWCALPYQKTLVHKENGADYLATMLSYVQEVAKGSGAADAQKTIDYLSMLIAKLPAGELGKTGIVPKIPWFICTDWSEQLLFFADGREIDTPRTTFYSWITSKYNESRNTFTIETYWIDQTPGPKWKYHHALDLLDLTIYVDKGFPSNIVLPEPVPLYSCNWAQELRLMQKHASLVNAVKPTPEGLRLYDYLKYIEQFKRCDVTGVEGGAVEAAFELKQNYPNPFNPVTTIAFSLAQRSDVKIMITDTLGRTVKSYELGGLEPGTHQVTWDASGENSGVYNCTLIAGDKVQTRQMALVK